MQLFRDMREIEFGDDTLGMTRTGEPPDGVNETNGGYHPAALGIESLIPSETA